MPFEQLEKLAHEHVSFCFQLIGSLVYKFSNTLSSLFLSSQTPSQYFSSYSFNLISVTFLDPSPSKLPLNRCYSITLSSYFLNSTHSSIFFIWLDNCILSPLITPCHDLFLILIFYSVFYAYFYYAHQKYDESYILPLSLPPIIHFSDAHISICIKCLA